MREHQITVPTDPRIAEGYSSARALGRTILAVLSLALIGALLGVVVFATAARAAGSDSPTPYTVDQTGITLPAGQTFPAHGHVNVRWTNPDGAAARVLLEPEGLLGDPAQGITPRPLFAPAAGRGAGPGRVTRALTTRSSVAQDDQQTDQLVVGVLGQHAHTLTAEGHDASEDGTGRGTPIVAAPAIAATLTAGTSGAGVSAPGRRQEDDLNIVAFDPKAGGDRTSSGAFENGTGITPTLQGSRPHAVAFHVTQDPISGETSPALGTTSTGMGIAYAARVTTALDTAQGGPDDNAAQGGHLVAFQKVIRPQTNQHPEVWAERDIAATLNLNDLGSESRAVEVAVHLDSPGLTVRRLTPLECERLQGFPDGHTATSNGRPQADSPRYKQMGNAVAVPVFAWVARRIAAVDAAIREAVSA